MHIEFLNTVRLDSKNKPGIFEIGLAIICGIILSVQFFGMVSGHISDSSEAMPSAFCASLVIFTFAMRWGSDNHNYASYQCGLDIGTDMFVLDYKNINHDDGKGFCSEHIVIPYADIIRMKVDRSEHVIRIIAPAVVTRRYRSGIIDESACEPASHDLYFSENAYERVMDYIIDNCIVSEFDYV